MPAPSKPPKLVEISPGEVRTVCWQCGNVIKPHSLWCDDHCRHGRKTRKIQEPIAKPRQRSAPVDTALVEKLWEEGLTARQIAEKVGLAAGSVYSMRKVGVNLPHRQPQLVKNGEEVARIRWGR